MQANVKTVETSVKFEEGLVPEGYDVTRVGWVQKGERYINEDGGVSVNKGPMFLGVIVEKSKRRKPTLDDLGRYLETRVRDYSYDGWNYEGESEIEVFRQDGYDVDGNFWKFVEVRDKENADS